MNAANLPQLTLPQMLRQNAQQTPDGIAIRQKDFGIWNPVTWRDYFERACDVGHGFSQLGLPEGGHIAVLSENRLEWVLAQLGAGTVGAVTIGVYPTSPANEVAYVLNHSQARIVVCEDQEQADKVLEARGELPDLQHIVVVETKGLRGYPAELVVSFEELEARGREARLRDPGAVDAVLGRQSMSDIALMIYTSGSTGKPKGAMLSYRNIRAQAIAAIDKLGLTAQTTHLSYLPLCHVAEQFCTVMTPVYLGSQINFGESIRTVQEDLREVAPSMFLGVPRIWEKLHSSIYIRMLEAGGYRRRLFDWAYRTCEPFAEKAPGERSMREGLLFRLCYLLVFRSLQNYVGLRRAHVAMTGAAPISPTIVRFFRTLGVPLVEVYGATETSGIALGQTMARREPGSVGSPIVNAEARIGDHGELLIRGDTVFAGYYRNEEATASALRDDWLHTGDVVDQRDGQYRIIDRLKDIIITAGGKNLSPSEIENTVKGSPYIKECIVIGEARKYVSALIQIDYETVSKWAEDKEIAFTNFRSLTENSAVRDLIEGEIAAANSQLAQVSQVKRFHLLTKELDHDDDEVTATMKVRRANVQRKYAGEIEALYSR
ncbi:AMP-dependent synthetase/ligase [Tianweitania sediminis]|uniref:AMP-binding protein n=1 Tax=Tianweitania sediminis TaxID=1502156 RepID=A0A8J7R539_9HYPH|nr:AMP-binding protein [Tianweitania sediminis]MBP0441418.1 AMP-binding protein [Tianweitania sediminis]